MIERFSPTHYVPLLRWKRGEQVALLKMKAEDAMRLTPLVELVNENFMDRERNLLNNDVVIEKITR
ncbi:MAG: hypothetical protein Q7T57_04255 [Dehalococcoidales bacterium]|nr:hypothetical protein [Dehalococcoidales bacterium]